MRFQYDYAVLPEAIISRFIVKLRRFIESILKLMIEAYRRLPLLRGRDVSEKALEKKKEA